MPNGPYLFVIVVDVIFYILRAQELRPPSKGITLPNNDLVNDQFTNDTTLFLELDESNSDNVIHRLQLLFSDLGSKIAPNKSIVIGRPDSPPNWISHNGWIWNGPINIVRYLGIPFAVEPSDKDMWKWVYTKIEKKKLMENTYALFSW